MSSAGCSDPSAPLQEGAACSPRVQTTVMCTIPSLKYHSCPSLGSGSRRAACGVAPLVDKETMVDSSCELLWILQAGSFTPVKSPAAL